MTTACRRFGLLQHFQASGDHFDLMLEDGDQLLTWRLPHLPAPGIPLEAEKIADHRLAYLDYEGPISGDRGRVVRTDRGIFEVVSWEPKCIRVTLAGVLLRGDLVLHPCLTVGGGGASWTLTLTPKA